MFDHIVVPLDGSELSETALAYVGPLAKRLGSRVVLLYAESDPYAEMFGGGESLPVYATSEGDVSPGTAADYLESVCERLTLQGVRCEPCTSTGAPAAVILKYVEENNPDLIAMSTHGRSGVRRMVVGSVTTTILPRAETPVLVIHPGDGGVVPETSFESMVIR